MADVDVDDVLRDTLAILSAARRGDDEAIDVLLAHADWQRVLNVLTGIFLGLVEACDVDTGAWLAAEQGQRPPAACHRPLPLSTASSAPAERSALQMNPRAPLRPMRPP